MKALSVAGIACCAAALLPACAFGAEIAREPVRTPAGLPPTAVWLTSADTISLYDVALHLAPILWFSPDEHLLVRAECTLPARLPCDKATSDPVVYFNVTGVTPGLHHGQLRPKETSNVTVKFHFYYPTETGLGAHLHDIETVTVYAAFENAPLDPGYRLLKVEKVVAEAHYLRNVLSMSGRGAADDVVLPITVLVEEGKHGNCPDRNADGVYTPGYDINRDVNDAWGLRDIMGSGRLTTHFDASQAKARRQCDDDPARCYRVAPPLPADDPIRFHRRAWPSYTYDLRSAHELSPCPTTNQLPPCVQEAPKEVLALEQRMKELGFGRLAPRSGIVGLLAKALPPPSVGYGYGAGHRATLAFRFSEGFFPFPLELRYELAFEPDGQGSTRRLKNSAFSLVVSPSQVRLLDWYASLGGEFHRDSERTFAEGGVRMRWRQLYSRLGMRALLDTDFGGSRAGFVDDAYLRAEVGVYLNY